MNRAVQIRLCEFIKYFVQMERKFSKSEKSWYKDKKRFGCRHPNLFLLTN
jgi:hypothetical protein